VQAIDLLLVLAEQQFERLVQAQLAAHHLQQPFERVHLVFLCRKVQTGALLGIHIGQHVRRMPHHQLQNLSPAPVIISLKALVTVENGAGQRCASIKPLDSQQLHATLVPQIFHHFLVTVARGQVHRGPPAQLFIPRANKLLRLVCLVEKLDGRKVSKLGSGEERSEPVVADCCDARAWEGGSGSG